MRRRVLFVDDDPHVLDGLRLRLRRQRDRWDMVFAGGGRDALDMMESAPFDVLVTDLRMPGMDGATLLAEVQARHPHTARIVLSGHAELETTLRAINVAHQFLAKPCDAGVLENVVDRACALHALVGADHLRRAVGRVEHLPSLPVTYTTLRSVLQNEHMTARTVADVLAQDLALSTKILQLVNSAFFRLSRPITDLEEAVIYLGFDTILRVTLAVEVYHRGHGIPRLRGFKLEALQRHAHAVAVIAASLFDDRSRKDAAFTAGLLHDVGRLVVAVGLPAEAEQLADFDADEIEGLLVEEQRILETTHAELGAYLLALWGLPYPIVEAVAHHHHPWHVDTQAFDLVAATYTADALVHEHHQARRGRPVVYRVDEAYLSRAGLHGSLDSWRNRTATLLDDLQEAAGGTR